MTDAADVAVYMRACACGLKRVEHFPHLVGQRTKSCSACALRSKLTKGTALAGRCPKRALQASYVQGNSKENPLHLVVERSVVPGKCEAVDCFRDGKQYSLRKARLCAEHITVRLCPASLCVRLAPASCRSAGT
jgi:hypothetical protein